VVALFALKKSDCNGLEIMGIFRDLKGRTRPNAIKLRNFIGIQTVRLWIIRLKYQTLPNLKVWTPMLNLMVVEHALPKSVIIRNLF